MCIICIQIEKNRMTSSEAYKAAGSGELLIDPDHAWDLINNIEALRKKEEIDSTFNDGDLKHEQD